MRDPTSSLSPVMARRLLEQVTDKSGVAGGDGAHIEAVLLRERDGQ